MTEEKKYIPLNVCTRLLLIICHNCGSPTFGAITKCCLSGETSNVLITPVPVTVIQRICDGRGTGSQPVNGTNNGTV